MSWTSDDAPLTQGPMPQMDTGAAKLILTRRPTPLVLATIIGMTGMRVWS